MSQKSTTWCRSPRRTCKSATLLSNDITWLVLATMLPAALIATLSIYPVRRYAVRLGLLDRPGGHSTHVRATPLGGGIGIYAGVVGTLCLGMLTLWWVTGPAGPPNRLITIPPRLLEMREGIFLRSGSMLGLIAGGTVLMLLGLADDRSTVSPWWRLAIEFGVAAAVVCGLGFELTAFISVPWLTRLLSVIWIVGVINAFNMLDNMDGLSAGVAAIISASMAAAMFVTPNPDSGQPQVLVATLLLITSGSLIGFLWHNLPPAKIFMGDAGSYFVGYLVAVSMLMATFAGDGGNRPHAVFAPLCAMAVPLYDMTTVIWIRIRNGQSIFVGDRNHFSHRLVDLGLSKGQAVATIYLLSATCGLASVLLVGVSIHQSLMVVGIVVCMLLLIIILESARWTSDDEH